MRVTVPLPEDELLDGEDIEESGSTDSAEAFSITLTPRTPENPESCDDSFFAPRGPFHLFQQPHRDSSLVPDRPDPQTIHNQSMAANLPVPSDPPGPRD